MVLTGFLAETPPKGTPELWHMLIEEVYPFLKGQTDALVRDEDED